MAYKMLYPADSCAGLVTSYNTRLLPHYVLALLKHVSHLVGCFMGFLTVVMIFVSESAAGIQNRRFDESG